MCVFLSQRSPSCLAVFFDFTFAHTLLSNISCASVYLTLRLSCFADTVCVLLSYIRHHVTLKKLLSVYSSPCLASTSCGAELSDSGEMLNVGWAAFPARADKLRYKVRMSLFSWQFIFLNSSTEAVTDYFW